MDMSLIEGERLCDTTAGCQSFAYNPRLRDCWVKDKCVTAADTTWTAKLAREPQWNTHY
eukprot:gene5850-4401_t